jgi:hypothetical protein
VWKLFLLAAPLMRSYSRGNNRPMSCSDLGRREDSSETISHGFSRLGSPSCSNIVNARPDMRSSSITLTSSNFTAEKDRRKAHPLVDG